MESYGKRRTLGALLESDRLSLGHDSLAENLIDLIERPVDLGLSDRVGRHEVDNVAQGAQKQAALEKGGVQARAYGIEITGRRGGQFHDSYSADHTHVAQAAQRFEAGAELPFERLHALDNAVFAEQVETGQGYRAGERVGGVGVAVEKGFAAVLAQEGFVDGLSSGRGAERQVPRGERLRHTDQIGADGGVLAGEHAAGAAKPGEYFVGNQKRAVTVAQGACA